tara:strand:+ start:26812 stop:27315 length:504 start_codon:yes stop_codon:yes gene_type:complete
MAKQVINIGTTANDGTGDPLRSAFDKVNDNFTELYDDDAGDVNSITATAPIVRDSPDGNVTISLADDGITYAKLGTEFKTSAAVAALAVDFSSAQVFTKTITADSTFTFTNVGIGMVKDLILTGDFVPTFPAGSKIVAGTYDGTVSNLIQIVVAGSGDYWLSISKAQ